ncbi:MAG: type II toxin-antitoxin system HicA family toxin [Chitinophagaceae bacterium]|jgi:predicted RNA binding protein YcfA (HicA-like mRNA interferase family)|nr:type II toxin-antitoxin system HicA family toxin [Chitinophagaceae bacterium]
MKTPRSLTGRDLMRSLKKLGYLPTRQSGSHIRLSTLVNGEHHITIPDHSPLKIGTLSAILNDVALHHGLNKAALINMIF